MLNQRLFSQRWLISVLRNVISNIVSLFPLSLDSGGDQRDGPVFVVKEYLLFSDRTSSKTTAHDPEKTDLNTVRGEV